MICTPKVRRFWRCIFFINNINKFEYVLTRGGRCCTIGVLIQVVRLTDGRRELMLTVDKYSTVPIYEQIIDGIEKDVLLGVLREGDAVPSVRELSVTLGINPNTIQKAYVELERRGITVPLPGRGSFVRSGAIEAIRREARSKLDALYECSLELRMAGVSIDELIRTVKRAYGSEEEDK